MTGQIRAKPRLHHPNVALMRKHDALRRAGRARRIEEHRRLVRRRHNGVERPGIEEAVETRLAGVAEAHRRHILRTIRATRHVAEHELHPGILDDELDDSARELEVHRHGDQARPHDAEIGGEIFGAVGGQNGDALAALEPAPDECARDTVCHVVELAIGELARTLFASEIDDGDFCEVAADQVAEIVEKRHRGQLKPTVESSCPAFCQRCQV